MSLDKLLEQYINYRKSLGENFISAAKCLKTFGRKMDASKNIKSITEENINYFLYGDLNEVKSGWFVRHTALSGFYRYAFTRGYVNKIPMPKVIPKKPQAFIPYIYTKNELKLMFKSALTYKKNLSRISPITIQFALILIYSLGLRLQEALCIKISDIDLKNSVITIQESKFYKSRLLPFNNEIKDLILKYFKSMEIDYSENFESHLFSTKNNKKLSKSTFRIIFQRIREISGIHRDDNSTYQPRIHDLRHTFAVNRLVSWYRENKDVQKLLPILSVYLGHTDVTHTTVYLTMTDDLLQQANNRFEKYAMGGKHENT